jgi:ATP-dependent Clp protease ATP-binding subunit ClpA
MFERYTERARRVIFFARYEASQFGSVTIETEHFLLGLSREDKDLMNRFLGDTFLPESIRKEIESLSEKRAKTSTSIDLPLSDECKRILAYANEETERLGARWLDTEHLLLGILREEACLAARILHERGLRVEAVRDELARNAGHVKNVRSYTIDSSLVTKLAKHGFATAMEHFLKATTTGGDFKTAQTELKLFMQSLVDAIQEHNPGSEVFAPIFDGFDWRTSVQSFSSGLSEEKDWRFRLRITLLFAELLLDRYERR